jgi:UDP-glucuronate 4-epimerase
MKRANMAEERFLVTGALGCIGAWVIRNLVREGVPSVVYDLGGSQHRLRLIMTDDELAGVHFINGDVTDLNALESAIKDTGTTHIIHLAGLQVPFCKADPSLGARVNVVGTVNMFEAAKRAGLKNLVYASSVAVYGLSEEYPEGAVAHDAALKPRNHYGVYKQANEGTARIYWMDDDISSIGLRPYIVYGAGRDQGMTSYPTKAMMAAAFGKPYNIPFGGRAAYQYADDTARTFIQAARAGFQGAEVFNLRGSVVKMTDIVGAIETLEPSIRGSITYKDNPLALPEETDDAPLVAAIGNLPYTPLQQGVAETIATFKQGIADGRITLDNLN